MGSKIPLKENKTAGLAEEAESKGVEAVLKDLLAGAAGGVAQVLIGNHNLFQLSGSTVKKRRTMSEMS